MSDPITDPAKRAALAALVAELEAELVAVSVEGKLHPVRVLCNAPEVAEHSKVPPGVPTYPALQLI